MATDDDRSVPNGQTAAPFPFQQAVDELRSTRQRPKAREDLEAIVKSTPPHVRAEWERQQRIVRAAVTFVRAQTAGPFSVDDIAALEELIAAVRAFR